jgi:hypothetical protein
VGEEPEKKGKRDAKKKASDDGKVKRGVFAAMNDVAGKLSQAEGEFVAEVQKCTNKNEKCSQGKKGAAEIAERVHEVILPEAGKQVFRQTLAISSGNRFYLYRSVTWAARVLNFAGATVCLYENQETQGVGKPGSVVTAVSLLDAPGSTKTQNQISSREEKK